MTLTQVLTANLMWCQRNRPQPIIVSYVPGLPKGLSLKLYVDVEGINHVMARRLVSAWPAESEISALMRAWPQQPAPPLPWNEPVASGHALEVHRRTHAGYNCVYFQWKPLVPVFGKG